MPIYAYRCECGKTADVLVRSGLEPSSCDDVPELSGMCASPGRLSRQLTAAYVAKGGATSKSSPDPTCGHCGSTPGSCGVDN